ncbi:RHS repeat-associated core domain-containing protein [Pseudomonas sp. I2]|uniref:RHS repeat-associated core domain-containing protein n=1 Tax=Pseudomonas sp. I2 TaxID=1338438 RepID=UPI0034D563E4
MSVKQGATSRTILRGSVPLAEQHTDTLTNTGLLITDDKGSVLQVENADTNETHAYSAYGYASSLPSLRTLIGFNGESLELQTQNYFLGSGYRAFSPILMRFYSPDSWSPFGQGDLNTYAYCQGDPINRSDPSGHSGVLIRFFKGIGNRLGMRTPRPATANTNRSSFPENRQTLIHSRSSNSLGGGSSGYNASLESNTTTSSTTPPSLPQHSPSRTGSRFSTNNPERLATGQSDPDIARWISNIPPDAEHESMFSAIRPLSRTDLLNAKRLGVQRAGKRIDKKMTDFMARHHPGVLYMNANEETLTLQQKMQKLIRRV